MNEAPAHAPDDELELEADVDDQAESPEPALGSFFGPYDVDADGLEAVEAADETACAAVWSMFAKDSTQRGFDARAPSQRKLSAWRAANPGRGLQMFDRRKTEMKEKIVEAHAKLTKTLGRPPTAREVHEAAGVPCSQQNVAQILTRAGLAQTKTRGPNATKLAKPREASAEKPPVTGKARSGRAGGLARAAKRKTEPRRPARRPPSPPCATPALAALRDELGALDLRRALVEQAITALEALEAS